MDQLVLEPEPKTPRWWSRGGAEKFSCLEPEPWIAIPAPQPWQTCSNYYAKTERLCAALWISFFNGRGTIFWLLLPHTPDIKRLKYFSLCCSLRGIE